MYFFVCVHECLCVSVFLCVCFFKIVFQSVFVVIVFVCVFLVCSSVCVRELFCDYTFECVFVCFL